MKRRLRGDGSTDLSDATIRDAHARRRLRLVHLEKLKREKRDIQLINAHAHRLNAEAMDVIGYQSPHNRY
jgi:hypothetical protein